MKLETANIKQVTPDGIETESGVAPCDVIVLSTGFQTQDFLSPLTVSVDDGSDLRDFWGETPRAHLGITVAGFPNLFVMYGPNTNTGAGSILFFLECQANHIAQLVAGLHTQGCGSVAVRQDVMDKHNVQLQQDMKKTPFVSGCGSWYVNKDGIVTPNWAGSMTSYWRRTRSVNFSDYVWTKAAQASQPLSKM